MRIKLEVSGGFAGLHQAPKEIDSESLDEHGANRWRELLARANFFQLPCESLTKNGCDLMQYKITVQDGSKLHQVTLDDITLTNELRQIVSDLQAAK